MYLLTEILIILFFVSEFRKLIKKLLDTVLTKISIPKF